MRICVQNNISSDHARGYVLALRIRTSNSTCPFSPPAMVSVLHMSLVGSSLHTASTISDRRSHRAITQKPDPLNMRVISIRFSSAITRDLFGRGVVAVLIDAGGGACMVISFPSILEHTPTRNHFVNIPGLELASPTSSWTPTPPCSRNVPLSTLMKLS
ncbi:hypothetical protein BASA62_007602 [Batrachochytrium salamandrivorans]|nr:hypothetical protein BASA62_007602 [Batrachochytrium salamandrivorans]